MMLERRRVPSPSPMKARRRTCLGDLSDATVMDDQGYTLDYPLERPGTYIFAMEPQPYWEPAEDAFIIHYTKTYRDRLRRR